MTFGKGNESSYFAFFESHKHYNITRFQRSYTWKEYQIQGILDDLTYIRETGKQVGWPSILIQKSYDDGSEPNVQNYDLGDGQQRIISVSLGLIAIWQRAYTKLAMNEISSDQFEYFRSIVPEYGRSGEGILAKSKPTPYGLTVEPTIKFYSEIANDTFKSLFSPLTSTFWESIGSKIDSSTDGSGILRAFRIYYEAFNEYDIGQLKDVSKNLLSQITLSVLEYDSDDNMQRAFANMNSFGVSLTESELIKSEFYGHFKSKDLILAEELAKYWTNELESPYWKATKSNTSGWGNRESKSKKSPLEYFLEEFSCLYENWEIAIQRPNAASNPRNSKEHWLRDDWSSHLRNINNVQSFWEDFKKSIELFKTAHSVAAFTPGTIEWEINYTFQLLSNVLHIPSILMKLQLSMSEEDFRRSLILLQKYYMYLEFVPDESRNLNQSIIKSGSPILSSEISFEDFEKLLKFSSGKKSQWRSKSYIEYALSKATYGKTKNASICELFIYAMNDEKRSKGALSGMFNTRTHVEGEIKSREHILPQTYNTQLTIDDQAVYDKKVEMLGNSLILSKDLNSSASNRDVGEKLSIYEDSKLSPWGGRWIEEFMEDFRKSEKWWYEDIQDRSERLAKQFAAHLSITEPYTEFSNLLEKYDAGEVFSSSAYEEPVYLKLTSAGLLEFESIDGKIIEYGTLRDLKVALNDATPRKRLDIFRSSPDHEPSEKITLNLDKLISIENIINSNVKVEINDSKIETLRLEDDELANNIT